MKQRYGNTQVCEFRLSPAEVDALVIENVAARCNPSYDFDREHPVLLKLFNEQTRNYDYVVRFVQLGITQDGSERNPLFKPLAVSGDAPA